MVKRLGLIVGWCVCIAGWTFVVAAVAKPPIVLVGKIEQTYVPVDIPPAIWR